MPAVQLCEHCRQIIETDAQQYVVLVPQTAKAAEVIAHVTCEQRQAEEKSEVIQLAPVRSSRYRGF
jgi:hypothetical protein